MSGSYAEILRGRKVKSEARRLVYMINIEKETW